MRPERNFWISLALLVAAAVASLAGLAAIFYLVNREQLRSFPPGLAVELAVFIGVAALILLALPVAAFRGRYRRYVIALHRLSEDLEALVHGSPRARLPADPPDPTGLEPLLNVLMERFHHNEEVIEKRLEAALGHVTEEKTRLESLLDAMSEGVVVFSPEGRIVRYNHAAKTLFNRHGQLGAGLPVTGLVESAVLDFAQERLQSQIGTETEHPHIAFHCVSAGGNDGLSARIAPLLVYGGRL